MLDSPPRIDLVELGPGRGLFAQDVLDWTAKKFPEFHRALHATLVEASPGLRARLEERFAEHIAAGKVQVVETIEPAQIEGEFIVFANEFFDALPVEVVADRGELRIGVENGRFVESFVPPSAQNWISSTATAFIRKGRTSGSDAGFARSCGASPPRRRRARAGSAC